MNVTIPIYNEKDKIIGLVNFEDNLTLSDAPAYVNQNGKIGLKRLDKRYGKLENNIVFMFYDPKYPKTSYAEIISDQEAYIYCLNRGKLKLANKLQLEFVEEVEVL